MKGDVRSGAGQGFTRSTYFWGAVTLGVGIGQYLNISHLNIAGGPSWLIGLFLFGLLLLQGILFWSHGVLRFLIGCLAGIFVGFIQSGLMEGRGADSKLLFKDNAHVRLEVLSELRAGRPGEARFTALMQGEDLKPNRYLCTIRRLPWRNAAHLKKGGVHAAFVSLRASSRDRWGRYEARRGIVGRCKVRFLSIQSIPEFQVEERTLLKSLQVRYAAVFSDENIRALVQGMTLGQGAGMGRELYLAFQEWGLVHLLVVSGLHVGALYLFVSSLLTFVVGSFVAYFGLGYRMMRYLPQLVGLSIVWGYITLLEFSVSATRAGVGLTCFLLSQTQGSATSFFDRIVIAAAIVSALWPGVWEELGFQLTFTALFSLLGVLHLVRWKGYGRVEGYFLFAFLPSLLTSIVFYLHTEIFSPFGQLGNLFFAPVYVFCGFYGGVGTLLLSLASTGVARVVAGVIEGVLSLTNETLLVISRALKEQPGFFFRETLQDELGFLLWFVSMVIFALMFFRETEKPSGTV